MASPGAWCAGPEGPGLLPPAPGFPSQGSAQAHRRLWLESFGTHFLLSLGEACVELALPRLERLVEEVLYERLKDEPPVALDPEIEKLLPY